MADRRQSPRPRDAGDVMERDRSAPDPHHGHTARTPRRSTTCGCPARDGRAT